MPKKIASNIERQIAQDYAAGDLVWKIASKYNVSPASVSRVAKAHHIPLRQPTDKTPRKNRISKKEERAIIREYFAGTPITNIAARFKHNPTTIHHIRRRNGISANRLSKSRKFVTYHSGYKKIFKPTHPNADKEGYVYEHVFLASKALGRPLKLNEQVHHMTRNKSDNSNLLVCTKAYHRFLHTRMDAKTVEWATQNGCPYPWL